MVCNDGAPQVSKPARAPAGAGGEEGSGLADCVGNPVPVGAGAGQDGGIQVGGAGLLGGADACGTAEAATTLGHGPSCAPPDGQGPGAGVLPDGCWPEDGAEFDAVVPVGADCWVIWCTPARTCMISSGLVPYVAVMAGALSGMATESSRSWVFAMMVPGTAGMFVLARLAPRAARRSVRTGVDRCPGVAAPPMLTVSARPTTCAGQSGLGPGVPR